MQLNDVTLIIGSGPINHKVTLWDRECLGMSLWDGQHLHMLWSDTEIVREMKSYNKG